MLCGGRAIVDEVEISILKAPVHKLNVRRLHCRIADVRCDSDPRQGRFDVSTCEHPTPADGGCLAAGPETDGKPGKLGLIICQARRR
jgi:hypothetical protein